MNPALQVLTVTAHAWEQGDNATVAVILGAFLTRLRDHERPDDDAERRNRAGEF